MTDIYPVSDGHGVHTVVLELGWRQACYVLACLGASSGQMFSEQGDLVGEAGPSELFSELKEALGVEDPRWDHDKDILEVLAPPNRATKLFRKYSAVLDAWFGNTNYNRAKRVAEEVGL